MSGSDGVACVACGSQLSDAHSWRNRYLIATCRTCGLGWLTDPPQGDELAALYSSGFYEPGPTRVNGLAELGHVFNNAVRMRLLRGVARGRLLDVGSGRGRFLAAAKAAGWEVVGIELEPEMAKELSRRFGIDVVVGTAIDAEAQGPFDVITMWHVLEHLPDPLAALMRASDSLRPEGMLIVSVPNYASAQARLGGDHWLHLDIPRHIYHFSPDPLSRLVERAGFRVERIGHFYPEMEILVSSRQPSTGWDWNLISCIASRSETARPRTPAISCYPPPSQSS